MNQVSTHPSAMELLMGQTKLDTKVSQQDLVNIFISRYETQLHDRRAELQALYAKYLADYDQLVATVRTQLMVEHQPNLMQVLGDVDDTTLTWSEQPNLYSEPEKNNWSVQARYKIHAKGYLLTLDAKQDNSTWVGFNIYVPIDTTLSDAKKALTENVGQVNKALAEINTQLQQMDRRARQVHAELAAKKLADAGLQDVLADEGLAKLFPALPALPQ